LLPCCPTLCPSSCPSLGMVTRSALHCARCVVVSCCLWCAVVGQWLDRASRASGSASGSSQSATPSPSPSSPCLPTPCSPSRCWLCRSLDRCCTWPALLAVARTLHSSLLSSDSAAPAVVAALVLCKLLPSECCWCCCEGWQGGRLGRDGGQVLECAVGCCHGLVAAFGVIHAVCFVVLFTVLVFWAHGVRSVVRYAAGLGASLCP
jgi:hypothetical protein